MIKLSRHCGCKFSDFSQTPPRDWLYSGRRLLLHMSYEHNKCCLEVNSYIITMFTERERDVFACVNRSISSHPVFWSTTQRAGICVPVSLFIHVCCSMSQHLCIPPLLDGSTIMLLYMRETPFLGTSNGEML